MDVRHQMLVITDDTNVRIETYVPHASEVTFTHSKNVGLVCVRTEENKYSCMFRSQAGVVGTDSNTRTYFDVTTKFVIW